MSHATLDMDPSIMNGTKPFDVEKRQKSLFEASVQNSLEANNSIRLAQTSLLSLGLAELAFLSVVLLQKEQRYSGFIKSQILLLVLSFLFFLVGSIRQYQYAVNTARYFEKKSNRAIEYLEQGKIHLESEPVDLRTHKQQIKSDKITNYLFLLSLLLILITTILTVATLGLL